MCAGLPVEGDLLAGSSALLGRGASERRWLGGSELRLGGASELLWVGASERRFGGAGVDSFGKAAFMMSDDGSSPRPTAAKTSSTVL